MGKASRFSGFICIQHMVFFEVSIGIIANTILLLFHVLIFLLRHKHKATDLPIGHLAFIHIVMLLTMSFIAVDTFGNHDLVGDILCASVIYFNRLTQDLSICTTCLLSVIQAITLSPRSSCLAKFKQKSLLQNPCCFLFLWVFNMIINGRILISTVATPNVTSQGLMLITTSCSLLPVSSILKYTFFSLMAFEYMLFISLMALSSGYMVILLYKHKRQSQCLHTTSLFPRASPEQRATQIILLLMSFFVVIYSLDCIFRSTSSILWNHDPIHHCVLMLLGNGYAAVSPLVLISSERRMIRCYVFL